jgi:hypothetical protein
MEVTAILSCLFRQSRLRLRQVFKRVQRKHKRMRRMREECFAVYGEYAVSANLQPKPEKF